MAGRTFPTTQYNRYLRESAATPRAPARPICWRTVGLPDGEDRPGSEFSVLMIACLLGIVPAGAKGTAGKRVQLCSRCPSARLHLSLPRHLLLRS